MYYYDYNPNNHYVHDFIWFKLQICAKTGKFRMKWLKNMMRKFLDEGFDQHDLLL